MNYDTFAAKTLLLLFVGLALALVVMFSSISSASLDASAIYAGF